MAGVLLAIKLIDLALLGFSMASQVYTDLQATRSKLRQFANEGRDPTPAEWMELSVEVDRLLSENNTRAEEAKQHLINQAEDESPM